MQGNKRKEMDSEGDQQNKNKKMKFSTKNTEDFIKELRQSFETRSLANHQRKYGPLLNATLPIFRDRLDPFFLPYIGKPTLKQFFDQLGKAKINSQDNHLMAIAQTSGAGKTRLCFAVGHDPSISFFSIFIRFCENDTPTRPLTWLIRKIEDFDKDCDGQRHAERCLHLFRLFVFAHVEWAMSIANVFEDTQQSREACLRALQNGEGQKGVLKILEDRWQEYSNCNTNDSESTYLAKYLEEVESLVGKKDMLLFFDEVGFLKGKLSKTFINLDLYVDPNATATGRQNPDLYYGLRLLIVKLRQILTNWKICIADTHFSIFDVIAVAKNSPIRDQVVAFSNLHKLTSEDINNYLESLLKVKMKKASSELQQLLRRFQGRPKFFFSFLENLLESMERNPMHRVEDLFKEMLEQAAQSLKSNKVLMKKILDQYVVENRSFGLTTERTTRKLVAQIFIEAVFENYEEIAIDDNDVNADIVARGLMMSSSSSGKQTYRKEDEPIFFEALEELATESNLDFVSDYLAKPCAVLQYLESTKGVATEYLLAWYFMKTIRRSGSQSLHSLLTGIVPPDFTLLSAWHNVTVATSRGWPTDKDVPSPDMIGLVTNKNYSTIQYSMHQNVGPDLCFLVKIRKEAKKKVVQRMGVVAIQCKARETFQFADALRSVQLGYLWTDKQQRAIIDEYYDNDDTEVDSDTAKPFKTQHNQRMNVYECIDSRPSIAKYWFRVIYSSQPWPPRLVATVNEYNNTHVFTPVILITLTDKLFGEEVKQVLKATEETKFLPDPRSPNLTFIDHTTAKKLDEAVQNECESESESEEESDDDN